MLALSDIIINWLHGLRSYNENDTLFLNISRVAYWHRDSWNRSLLGPLGARMVSDWIFCFVALIIDIDELDDLIQ